MDEGELRRRLARLEVLTTLAILGSDIGLDEETPYILNSFIRRREELSPFDERELSYLIERLAGTRSSQARSSQSSKGDKRKRTLSLNAKLDHCNGR